MERLRAERGESAERAPDPVEPDERPALEEGDGEDVVIDGENNASDDLLDDDPDLEDEAAEDDEAEDDAEEDDIETRLERVERERAELEKQLSKVTANRKKMEEDYARSQESFVKMRHEVEDSLTELRNGAQWYANLSNQRLQQLQSVNPATLPAEQQAQYYQELNMATQQAQQMQYAMQQAQERERAERDRMKQREAEIALAVIKSRIPEWSNDHYRALGDVAQEFGYSPEEFAEVTDPRIIQLLHNQWKAKNTARTVERKLSQRKAKPPTSRSGKEQTRNARGQFEKAKRAFEPNKKGSFAQMKLAELRMERDRR